MHKKFAELVNAEFHFVDFKMRWQDREKSMLYRITSWFVCAFSFPSKKKYDIFLVDNLHFMPVLMKTFRLLNRRQKIVAHLGSHTLYFIYAHRFSKPIEYIHIQALKRYDALICEGKMAAALVKEILGHKAPKLYTVINGIPAEHFPKQISVDFKHKNILFIGHGTGYERMWYKGLDIMIEAFAIANKKDNELSFTIVGEWDKELQIELLKKNNLEGNEAISFVDETPHLNKYINKSALYLHCARGEAYGLTILIAMSYGLPALISDWTGAKEVIEQVDNHFITTLNAEQIAFKINWYFNLSEANKKVFSEKFKKISHSYTEEKALDNFKENFLQLEKDFGFIK